VKWKNKYLIAVALLAVLVVVFGLAGHGYACVGGTFAYREGAMDIKFIPTGESDREGK
jgi:hypothetical protein